MFPELKVLYMEDDPLSREVMDMILRLAMGVRTYYMFEDSSDFMQRLWLLPEHPTLILLDIHMTPLSGSQVLQMIRQDERYDDIPVIAVTASVMRDEVGRLMEQGFDGAIAKPLDVSTFPDLIRRVMDGESVWHVS